jgi:hypothetical protein
VSAILWSIEDNTHYGWQNANPRTDDHTHEVREVEPGTFAGFERNLGGDFTCTTPDYTSPWDARTDLEAGHPV